jgi:uncharacterized protein
MSKDPKIRFVEFQEKKLAGYTIVEGFPGMGLVGTIAAKYIVEKMGFEQIGFIDSDIFIPLIRIHKGIPLHPSRIYANDSLKMAVLVSEQIIPRNLIHRFGEATIAWVREKGIKRIVSLAGINTGDAKDKSVYGIASNARSKKMLEEAGIKVINEGITTGVTAMMLLELQDEDTEAVSIMGPVSIGADYKAAAELIEKVSGLLKLEIDVKPLLKEAQETEKELLKNFEKMRESNETVQKLEDQTPLMYT